MRMPALFLIAALIACDTPPTQPVELPPDTEASPSQLATVTSLLSDPWVRSVIESIDDRDVRATVREGFARMAGELNSETARRTRLITSTALQLRASQSEDAVEDDLIHLATIDLLLQQAVALLESVPSSQQGR